VRRIVAGLRVSKAPSLDTTRESSQAGAPQAACASRFSGGFPDGRGELLMWGTRAAPVCVGAGGRQSGRRIEARRTVKILVQREQRVRLQFPEDSPQLLLDAVHGVKKIPAVDSEGAGAQFPVRPEQEVIPEHTVLEIVQNSFCDEAKIGDILFVFAAPRRGALTARVRLERNAAQVPLLRDAPSETIATDSKN